MLKRGDIWVSAVLYIALGMIVITIILGAGLPLINKMRDRNTVLQTKTVMYSIDDNIKEVASEGPGSKRFLSPINIEGGNLNINETEITWSMKTGNKLMEPNIEFEEGALILSLDETSISKEYMANIKLRYDNIAILNLESEYGNPFSGTYSLLIEHSGSYVNDMPNITIKVS